MATSILLWLQKLLKVCNCTVANSRLWLYVNALNNAICRRQYFASLRFTTYSVAISSCLGFLAALLMAVYCNGCGFTWVQLSKDEDAFSSGCTIPPSREVIFIKALRWTFNALSLGALIAIIYRWNSVYLVAIIHLLWDSFGCCDYQSLKAQLG
jgi:hypothetical protein